MFRELQSLYKVSKAKQKKKEGRRLQSLYASNVFLQIQAGFYRAANSIFGKVGRIASEEVVLHLVKYKCMPILLYGFEAFNLNKSQLTPSISWQTDL